MKRFPFLLTLLSPLLLCAQDQECKDFNTRLTQLERDVRCRKCYNPPNPVNGREGYHLTLVGDYLYWKGQEDGLAYTYKTNNPSGASLDTDIDVKEPDFEWESGFRLGLGYNIPHDRWDLYISWIDFEAEADDHVEVDSDDGLFPYWAYPSGPAGDLFFPKANAHWHTDLDVIDVELGKSYYVGKRTSLRPHLGLRGFWIDQHYHIQYQGATVPILLTTLNDSIKMHNNYWGVGPRVGLNMEWWLGNAFQVYGQAAISLVYGEFEIHQKEEFPDSDDSELHFKDDLHIARPVTDLGIGLGWNSTYGCDSLHLLVRVGWEQHIFFDQNQFIRFVSSDTSSSLLSNRGDLSLEGLTASIRLDF